MIANYITTTTTYTAEIKTGEGEGEEEGKGDYKAWVDNSNRIGELETNDPDYAYNYLMMPRTVKEIADISIKALRHIDAEYEHHCQPFLTKNN